MLTEIIEQRTKVKEHPRATGEAGDGPRLPRGAAVSGRLFLPASATREDIALRTSYVAGAVPKRHSGNSDGDTTIELTSERSRDMVGPRVVWESKRCEKLSLRRPCSFFRRRGWSSFSTTNIRR